MTWLYLHQTEDYTIYGTNDPEVARLMEEQGYLIEEPKDFLEIPKEFYINPETNKPWEIED